jgi:hypothetical protein
LPITVLIYIMTSKSKTHKAKYELCIKTNAPFQGVTKRCRPSLQANSALSYEPNCGEREKVVVGSQPMSTLVQLCTESLKNKLWRSNSIFNLHTVKRLFDILVPSRDVTYQTLPGQEL